MPRYPGLKNEEVARRRELFGSNELAPPHRESTWRLFLLKFADPLALVLLLAVALAAVGGAWLESAGILLAVLLAALIGFANEYRAGRAFEMLNRRGSSAPVKVVRSGRLASCAIDDIVVDDMLFVESGDEIAADAEVVESTGFLVDQSKFTGEPDAVPKHPLSGDSPGSDSSTYPADFVPRGVVVLGGNAFLRVKAVGNATELGRAALAASAPREEPTPLQRQLDRLGKTIACVGVALAVLLLSSLLARTLFIDDLPLSFPLLLSFAMLALTLLVVVVPEGLPMSVTLSLAMSVRRMARDNVLIKHMQSCETIGCATVICTDKTGTLTQNRMTVAECVFPDAAYLGEALAGNSTAGCSPDEAVGNPTETALLRYAGERGVDTASVRENFRVLERIPFASERKYMATRGISSIGGVSEVCYFKGNPELLLAASHDMRDSEGVHELTGKERAGLLEAFKSEQRKARRVLAFAMSSGSGANMDNPAGLTFLGYAAITDPVRPEVPSAVAACRAAGIDVKIVTGDAVETAMEIARQCGIEVTPGAVIEGRDFAALSDVERMDRLKELKIVARARPDDKLMLVKALQRSGEVVAVTGDGANDSPALNASDVGVAMGKCGTAVAREAADIVLLDDSFASIVNGVLWGRSLYLNIQRFLTFQLTINFAAAAVAVAGPFFGIAMPFTVLQMLWINLIMDSFAALALASGPPTPEVLMRRPRRAGAFIVTPEMALRIAVASLAIFGAFVIFALWSHGSGATPHALTLLFSAFVLFQLWNLLNMRLWGGGGIASLFTRENWLFGAVVLFILALQIVIVQYGGAVFRTVPLAWSEWLLLLGATSVVFWAGRLWRGGGFVSGKH